VLNISVVLSLPQLIEIKNKKNKKNKNFLSSVTVLQLLTSFNCSNFIVIKIFCSDYILYFVSFRNLRFQLIWLKFQDMLVLLEMILLTPKQKKLLICYFLEEFLYHKTSLTVMRVKSRQILQLNHGSVNGINLILEDILMNSFPMLEPTFFFL